MRMLCALAVPFAAGALPRGTIPSVLLNSTNAALPGVRYPMVGLGTRGAGYKIGQKEECWHYPSCCTKDYCPSINATRDWLKMGGVRIDTGYPFGDSPGNPQDPHALPGTCSNTRPSGPGTGHGHWCDAHGTAQGIKQSGVKREDMFITIKSGFAGPMQEVEFQGGGELKWLGLKYADLYLMHEGDLGTPGHRPAHFCDYPTSTVCRLGVWNSCLCWMDLGFTRACGVANWEVEWLEELVSAGARLPAVVQVKFHLHQSTASPRIRKIKEFCDKHGILFNGYSPLGRADWTTFDKLVGTPTLLEEPAVLSIAQKVGKSAAQVLLRWNIQQHVPTQARSLNPVHMAENMDVFNWTLADDDMRKLSALPQCNATRGNPFMDGDPEQKGHGNMIGPTAHC